jgi:hypothetical protein
MVSHEITHILIHKISFIEGCNMIGLFVVWVLLLLIPSAMLVVLHCVDDVEDIEKKELQKLIGECLD